MSNFCDLQRDLCVDYSMDEEPNCPGVFKTLHLGLPSGETDVLKVKNCLICFLKVPAGFKRAGGRVLEERLLL